MRASKIFVTTITVLFILELSIKAFCSNCTVVSIAGCLAIDYNNTLGLGNTNNCGCLTCNTTFSIDLNYTCSACDSLIASCSTCVNTTSTPICTSCVATHVLNSSTNKCDFCDKTCSAVPLKGCLQVDSGNSLGVCNRTNCSCLTCAPYYGYDANHNCLLCNSTIFNCTSCVNLSSSSPVCTSCNASFFVNSTTFKCDACSTLYYGCAYCLLTVPNCLSCHLGYYMQPNKTCSRCPPVLGPLCWGCWNATLCRLCIPGFGISAPNTCVPCNNTLYNCRQCLDINTCYKCVSDPNIYWVNNSKCVTCPEAMANCQNCSSGVICASCNTLYGVNYTLVPNTCVLCSVAIPNCLTCPNYTSCDTCLNSSFILFFINDTNQTLCPPCQNFIMGCDTCVNQTYCLSCLNNTLLLYNSANQSCVPCSFYIPNCVTCLPSHQCLTCNSRYAVSFSFLCSFCSNYMVSCYECNSRQKCTLCVEGRLLPDKTGCTKTFGCVSVNPLLPIFDNCIACNNLQFLSTPQSGQCVCAEGWLVGSYCTTVFACTATNWNHITNKSVCIFCDVTRKFTIKNDTCICAQHYHLQGTVCIQTCGDGYVIKAACDDGNLIDGDGCSSTCKVESRHFCLNDNSRIPSSKCRFQAQVGLNLTSIQKTDQQNTTKLTFQISPYSAQIQKMNLTSLIALNAPGCTVISASIIDEQLVVYFHYSQSIDHEDAEFKMQFDSEYVRSPTAVVKFVIVQSAAAGTGISEGNELNGTISMLITVLSIISLLVFVLGSVAYRLVGVETLFTIQTVRILQAASEHYSTFFVQFQSLDYSYGQISSFIGESTPSETGFSKLGFKTSLSDNYLLLAAINGLAILAYVAFLAYRCKLKMQIETENTEDEKNISPEAKSFRKVVQRRIEKVNKLLDNLYNWALFPLFIGFFVHFIHTAFVFQAKTSFESVSLIGFFSIFSTFIATSFIFHHQLFNQQSKQEKNLKDPGNNNYIQYFLIHNFILFLVLSLIIINNIGFLYYLTAGLVAVHLIYVSAKRPYGHPLNNFSLVFNQGFILYSFFWVLTKNSSIDSTALSSLFVYLFIGLGFIVNSLGVIRSILILKQTQNQNIEERANRRANKKKKRIELLQQINFSGLKISIQEDNMFADKLISTKKDYIEPSYDRTPILSAERYNLNANRLKRQAESQIRSIKDLFDKK